MAKVQLVPKKTSRIFSYFFFFLSRVHITLFCGFWQLMYIVSGVLKNNSFSCYLDLDCYLDLYVDIM